MGMCYSVAQIAVNVFILCAPTQFDFADVKSAVSIWSEIRDEASPVDREFQAWVDGKGDVSSVRASCNQTSDELVRLFPPDFKRYFVDVMRKMLE